MACAEPSCPGPATVALFIENLSADPTVAVEVTGRLLDPAATCAGAGATSYDATFPCDGAGLVPCGEIAGLRPGAWVNRIAVTVSGSDPQLQSRRAVFLSGVGGVSNALAWTVYPRTLVVGDATQATLRAQLDAAAAYTDANDTPALVTFARAAFPGSGAPQTIDLARGPCAPDPSRHAAVCLAGSRLVVDALDDDAERGAVVWSVGTRALSVLRLYGSDNVLRGVVFRGSENPTLTAQVDTLAISGSAARRNRIEQCLVYGPRLGDGLSVEDGAGVGSDGNETNVVEASELLGAQKKGIKATSGASVTVHRSCVHDNQSGGLEATSGGEAVALENVIQHNLPRSPGNGLSASAGTSLRPTVLRSDGNVVRLAGGRGLSVTDDAAAVFRNDYVADNQFVGAKLETTASGPPQSVPSASFQGAAFVCNRNAGLTGTCQPQTGEDAEPCGVDVDCCGLPDGCCVSDPGCATPLRCAPGSYPRGFGVGQAQADGHAAPNGSYGDDLQPGHNAFTWNRNTFVGRNFNLKLPIAFVPARGNQWEHCGTATLCDVAAVRDADTGDVRCDSGPCGGASDLDLGSPQGPRAGSPVVLRITPSRPRRGDLVRVYGENFNAIEGTSCGPPWDPTDPCSGGNESVQLRNKATEANRVEVYGSDAQTLLQVLYPDAVTPAMLAFRMPFDCFAPLLLVVKKKAPSDAAVTRLTGTGLLCDPIGCEGQPAGVPCDDGNECTVDDVCDRDACLGTPKPAGTACTDDGNVCTADVCDAGGACVHPPDHAGTVCRPAAGACSIEAVCTGASPLCPPVAFQPAGTVCRQATGPCDAAEACTGASVSCPPDRLNSRGFVCRAAAGRCDAEERCSGTTSDCPPDLFLPAGSLCRAAADPCDITESCSGDAVECPPDLVREGCAGVGCAFERRLACGFESLPPTVVRGFARARALVAPWAATCEPNPNVGRLRRAVMRLVRTSRRIEKARRKGHLSPACATALSANVGDALRRLRSALPR